MQGESCCCKFLLHSCVSGNHCLHKLLHHLMLSTFHRDSIFKFFLSLSVRISLLFISCCILFSFKHSWGIWFIKTCPMVWLNPADSTIIPASYLYSQDKQAILTSLKPLQRGIVKCMTCDNTKVIRSVHSLLVRLMGIFPTEPGKYLIMMTLTREALSDQTGHKQLVLFNHNIKPVFRT